jgi:hypothetical protein
MSFFSLSFHLNPLFSIFFLFSSIYFYFHPHESSCLLLMPYIMSREHLFESVLRVRSLNNNTYYIIINFKKIRFSKNFMNSKKVQVCFYKYVCFSPLKKFLNINNLNFFREVCLKKTWKTQENEKKIGILNWKITSHNCISSQNWKQDSSTQLLNAEI